MRYTRRRMAAPKASILIIDDDAGILEVTRRGLERAGYAVQTAETSADGVAQARRGGFDLVLLDIELPDASGLVTLRVLLGEVKTPIVMMSGHADSEVAQDALLLGAKALLAKPFDLAALCEAIPRYLTA